MPRYHGSTGAFLDSFASGGVSVPTSLTFGSDGNLYVSSAGTDQVLRYNGGTGTLLDVFVAAGSGGLGSPSFLTFTPEPVAVPEPSSLMLLGFAALGLTVHALRRAGRSAT